MARIKGLKGGKTNITVSYGGKSATFSNFTVNKKTVTFSAPTLRTVSKYNGNGQALINSGSCTTGGTMYYYVSTSSSTPSWNDGSGWSTSLPTGKNALGADNAAPSKIVQREINSTYPFCICFFLVFYTYPYHIMMWFLYLFLC